MLIYKLAPIVKNMKEENKILQEIENNRVISFTKCDSSERYKALDRLHAFGLVYQQPKNRWHLTEKGYKAVSTGFEKWLSDNESPKPFIYGDNISIINGDSNTVNQSKSDNSLPKTSWLEKTTWIITIILFIIAIYEFIIKYILNDSK